MNSSINGNVGIKLTPPTLRAYINIDKVMEIVEIIKHKIKWKIQGYLISDKSVLINPKTGKRLIEAKKGYTFGYYLNGKFKSHKYIKENCEET